MPYIERGMRPPFDGAIHSTLLGRLDEAVDVIVLVVSLKKYNKVDGCLNYTFTQLLRKLDNLHWVKIVIINTIKKLFLDEPSYDKLERARGLLACMVDEFERRGWKEEAIPVLNELIEIVNAHKAEYENKKIAVNGDLD